MPTGVQGRQSRDFVTAQKHYLVQPIRFTDAVTPTENLVSTIIPAGSILTKAFIEVVTPFNGTGVDEISVGIPGFPGEFLGGVDVQIAGSRYDNGQFYPSAGKVFLADTRLAYIYIRTVDDNTEGLAHLIVEYVQHFVIDEA